MILFSNYDDMNLDKKNDEENDATNNIIIQENKTKPKSKTLKNFSYVY